MYQALYRKWRPQTFDEVVGQEHITQTLKRQVETGRLSHAYLFTGTRGTGKTTCAKLLARAVNCQHPVDGNPCNQCPACRGILSGAILDVMELDAASNNKVDDVRAILDEAIYTPAQVKKRVYIVDEVHMMSGQAFSALLQILEEPPAHLMFILATTELHKVPATIQSRCQQFSFKRIHPDALAARLKYVAGQEGVELTPQAAALLARLADGGLRDGLSLLDQSMGGRTQVDEKDVLEELGLAGGLETARLLRLISQGQTEQALRTLDTLYAAGKEMASLLGELATLCRDLLIRKTAPASAPVLCKGGYDEDSLRELSGLLDGPRLLQMLTLLQNTAADLAKSANRRIDTELCLIRMCDQRLDNSPTGLSARIASLEEAVARGVPSAPVREAAPSGAKIQAQPETVPPARGSDAPPPAEDDLPPWDLDEPVSPPPPAAKPARAGTAVRPAEPAPAPAAPPSAPAPSPASGDNIWDGLRLAVKSRLSVADYIFLGDPTMVSGTLSGEHLTLWVETDFIKSMINKPEILSAVEETAREVMGRNIRAAVKVGTAPRTAPQPAAPAAEETDALDSLLGLDNVTMIE